MTIPNGDHAGEATRPLRVLIAGAGIGGLTAAIALRQEGHEVHLYEQSRLAQEIGAAIHVAPNANGLLKRIGLDVRNVGSSEMIGSCTFAPSGEAQHPVDMRQSSKRWQHKWELVHRAHMHTALKDLAQRNGAVLHTASGVKTVDPSSATITLKDGTVVEGDVAIGADGVHSATRKFIPGGDFEPFDSGKSAFRFLIPTDVLEADPVLDQYFKKYKGYMLMWFGEDRRLVTYPCANGKLMNFVALHPSSESHVDASSGTWGHTGSKARMLQIYDSWDDSIKAILEKSDEDDLKIWQLLDMEKMPHFVEQRFALIGDAAHPFLPHQAQGGCQAIEDSLALAAVLPAGTPLADVPARLKIYEQQRFERSHMVQDFTRFAGLDAPELEAKGVKLDIWGFMEKNIGHDEWHSTKQALDKRLWAEEGLTKWRSPIGFGPAPGPRQPINMASDNPRLRSLREQTPETSSALSIKFKTSRTYLQRLLPPGFSFARADTVCEATLLCNELDGMTWLGGGGYHYIILAIHGVQYTKANGEKIVGAFLPVLLEDLADPIITGRDDLGMPKLFCDINVQNNGTDAKVKMSWRGAEFGTFTFKSMSDQSQATAEEPSAAPAEEGQLAYRYVPAVGQPGKADAEYAVFVPKSDPSVVGLDAKVKTTIDASFEFKACDWQKLPTLHHVAKVLAEMPVYGIVEAKHVKSTGVDDLSGARRIE